MGLRSFITALTIGVTDIPPVTPAPEIFGVISDDSFARGSLGSNYTTEGASTWSMPGSHLTVSGGAGTATHRLLYNYGHSSEKNKQTLTVQFTGTAGATTYGIGMGVADFSSPDEERTVYARFITSTEALGKIAINTYMGGVNTQRAISATGVTVNTNDIFTIEHEVHDNASNIRTHYVTVTRQAGGSVSTSWTETMSLAGATAGLLSYCSGKFALFSIGGAFTITNWKIEINDYRYIDTLFVGDSITYGLDATSHATRWAAVAAVDVPSYEVSAGGSDGTQRVLDKIQNIIDYHPRQVVLMIGGNDIFFGVSLATAQANYASIVSQLKAAGIIVKHCLATPRDTTNMTTWNAYISGGTFNPDVVIDTFTPLATGTALNNTYDQGDGVHPNQAGHTLIGNTVKPYLTI